MVLSVLIESQERKQSMIFCCSFLPVKASYLLFIFASFHKTLFLFQSIFFVVFFSVLILDVDYGIVIGVIYAIMTVMFRLQKPKVRRLGRLPESDLYRPFEIYSSVSYLFKNCQIDSINLSQDFFFRPNRCLVSQ